MCVTPWNGRLVMITSLLTIRAKQEEEASARLRAEGVPDKQAAAFISGLF